jgi:23S rRNA (guanosine2251-2'-O)-methyltransferase
VNLICGINPVLEALAAGTRHFDRLLVVKGIRNNRVSEAVSRATHLAIPLRFEPRETLDRMAAGIPHQGIIAVVSAKPVIDIYALLEPERDSGLVVVLDGVEDPRNLGAVLRTAEAAGADGVVLPERHSAGLSETVSRASAGALEHVRVARVGNVVQALETLKARGYWIVGFDASGRERWDAVDYKRKIALVLGGEGRGMRRLVREHCDHLVALPLFGHVASLNVSVAAGIALYEVIRQRGSVPSHVRPIPVRPSSAPVRIVGPGPEDGEHDPGARAVESEGDDVAADAEGFDGDEALRLLNLHEEAAWAGPTVLKPIDFRRGRGGPHRNHRRHPPPSRTPGGPPRSPAAPEAAAAPGGPRGEQRGRRKRRPGGQGKPGGRPRPAHARDAMTPAPGGAGDHSAAEEPRPGPATGASENEPPGGSASGAPPEGMGRSGRRRRRRRRH